MSEGKGGNYGFSDDVAAEVKTAEGLMGEIVGLLAERDVESTTGLLALTIAIPVWLRGTQPVDAVLPLIDRAFDHARAVNDVLEEEIRAKADKGGSP